MYKKNLMLLIVLVLLITGCTRITNNLDDTVNAIMTNSNNNHVNTVSAGYELYIPTGVKQVLDNENNQHFKIRNTDLYLYVDTISYYYKNTLNYQSENNYNYYYKKLLLDDKTGYIGINKEDEDTYYVKVIYNYSKIEFYTDYDNLPFILANSLIIQKSIKYNDNLIHLELSNDSSDGREIKYELDKPKDSESMFSTYLEEYVPEETEEVELPEDNQLKEVQE